MVEFMGDFFVNQIPPIRKLQLLEYNATIQKN